MGGHGRAEIEDEEGLGRELHVEAPKGSLVACEYDTMFLSSRGGEDGKRTLMLLLCPCQEGDKQDDILGFRKTHLDH